MGLSFSNVEKFPQRKAFLIFPEMEPCTFQPKPIKLPIKKPSCKTFLNFLIFLIFLALVLKNFLYFLSKESFPYIFSKEISYISKNRTLHFPAQAQNTKKIHSPKNFLYFRKYNFLTLILKKFLYLQK